MASEGTIFLDLSDDDDDCVLQSVTYKPTIKNNNNFIDNIFKENPLLTEVLEKCLNLERSDGMLRVINRTLLQIYKTADPDFKCSSDFVSLLKRTLIRLDKDPYHKFSHIKDLCESLRSSKFKKKRVLLITLDKKIRKKGFEKLSLKRKKCLERRCKKQRTDVIDLDKYEEIINLDQNDSIENGPIVIDDEKENNSSQENSDCSMEVNPDKVTVHDNQTSIKNSKNLNNQKENEETILHIDDKNENHSSQENDDCFIEINDDELRIHDVQQSDSNTSLGPVTNHKEHEENNLTKNITIESSTSANYDKNHYKNRKEEVPINTDFEKQSQTAKENPYCSLKNNANNSLVIKSKEGHTLDRSPEKLLVPQKVYDMSVEDKPPSITDLEKIKNIEREIATYKEWIVKLDQQEVTSDDLHSPYVTSDKYKEKIVNLYKKLCALTGSEPTKRREVRLTVIEGHPPGPVKRLERFLNRNIGEDGNPPFPDFNDVVKCVETANVNDKLGWNKQQVLREASALFTHCGRALQKRRQKREWSDLLSRVKAEEFDGDPADNDPELLARLEANRRVAVKKEADLLERYSMMQNLPPEQKNAPNVTRSQDNNAFLGSLSDNSSDENDSPLPQNLNKIIAPTKEIETKQLDSNKIVNVHNCNPKAHIEIETNECMNLVQNANLLMPRIIAESITNKYYMDEFGLKINDSKEISNVEVNSASNVTAKSESNVREVDCESNVGMNRIHLVSLTFESNLEENYETNMESNVGQISNVATNKINVPRLTFESNVEEKYENNMESNVGLVNLESNVATNKTNTARLTFESNIEFNSASNITVKSESNVGEVNFESNVAINKINVPSLTFESNIDANYESNLESNFAQVNFESNVATNKTHVSKLTFESKVEDFNLESNSLEVDMETNGEKEIIESIEGEVNFEPNSEDVNSEANVKIEFEEASIKTEPTENVAKILNDFGDNYTVSIFDIEDPFLVVEISDSSDEED